MFVLSDADWASDAVWVLLEWIMNELAATPLMAIITARDAELPDGLRSGDFGSLTYRVQPLGEVATAELLQYLDIDLSERNAARLVERCGGNPFFLEELVDLITRESAAGSGLTTDELVDQLMSGEVEQLPDTLRGTIAARLDGLDNGPRLLLQDAAVLGIAGPVRGLAEMARQARLLDDIGPDLERLVDYDLLEVRDGRFRFRSDLVRDVTYATITKTLRAQRHYQIAEFLEHEPSTLDRNSMVAALADHYRRSAQLVAEMGHVPHVDRATVTARALHWVTEAGFRALEADPPSAEPWFTAGLELAADNDTRAQMLYGRARVRLETGYLTQARDDLEQLDRLNRQDPLLRARTLVVRGNLERRSRNHTEAASMLREASDRLAALDAASDQALALRLLGLAELSRSDNDLARKALEASQRVAASVQDRRAEAWAFQSLAWQAFRNGRVDEASSYAAQARSLFSDINDSGGLTWTKGVEAWVLFHNGALADAEALVVEILPETKRRGDPWAEGVTQVLSASIHLWSGRPEQALIAAQRALAAAALADDVNLAVQARALQGRAHVSMANVSDGLQSLEQAFDLAEHQGDTDSRRLAAAANCAAAAARVGNAHAVMQWASRFDSMHARTDVVGESEVIVSLSLAMLEQGRVSEGLRELSWLDSDVPAPARASSNAVGALLDVANADFVSAQRRIDAVLSSECTYLDRFRARIALVGHALPSGADRRGAGDHGGRGCRGRCDG